MNTYLRLIQYTILFLLSAHLLISSNLNLLYKGTGDVLIGYAQEQAIPYVLETDNIEMGCMLSGAFTPFILSFSRVTTPPHQLAIIFNFLSGSCSEFKAKDEELRFLRAIHSKNVAEAEDARIAQKRLLSKAAKFQLKSYQTLELVYSINGERGCPNFTSNSAKFYWLIGLINGMQAVLNDLASSSLANVPLDIPLKISQRAACLDSKKWWGLPHAIQAAIWINFPNSKPLDVYPFVVLNQSINTGLQQNMRISQVIAIQVYSGLGETAKIKNIIRQHVAERNQYPTESNYKFLDVIATHHIQAMSDYLWTEATGKRTPIGYLGTFWDDPIVSVDTIDISNLL